MSTVAQIRERALRRYGLKGDGTEDRQFTHPLMRDLINEAWRWLAREARCISALKTTHLKANQDFVVLDPEVYDFDPDTVRAKSDGSTWRPLQPVTEAWLIHDRGSLEECDAGVPAYYWAQTYASESSHRRLYLHPTPNQDVDDGFRYHAWVYPRRELTDDDEFELPEAEDDCLLPAVNWRMALLERSHGRRDAPVEDFFTLAETRARALKSTLERHRNPGPRRVRVDRWDEFDY